MFVRKVRAGIVSGSVRRLIFELVIVFLGVYAAFWVENYREGVAEKERSLEVAQAIHRGLEDVIEAESDFIENSMAGLSKWQSAYERGELPAPFVFRITGSERAPRTVYEAIVQSRPAELFDAELMFELGYFYSEVLGVSDRYVRYAEFTETDVLPNLKRGPGAFYDGQELRPEYAAHMDRLPELIEMWSANVERAGDLKKRLAAQFD